MKQEDIRYYQDLERRYPLSWQLRLEVLRRRARREAEVKQPEEKHPPQVQYVDPNAPNFVHPPFP